MFRLGHPPVAVGVAAVQHRRRRLRQFDARDRAVTIVIGTDERIGKARERVRLEAGQSGHAIQDCPLPPGISTVNPMLDA